MTSQRDALIRAGILRPTSHEPGPSVSPAESPEPTHRIKSTEQIEFLARQLFNVMKAVLQEQDPEAELVETYAEVDEPMKDVLRAQAHYVLSTLADNKRLRRRVKELEEKLGVLATEA